MKTRWLIATFMVLVLVGSGCSTQKRILGKWRNLNRPDQNMEFLKDGVYIAGDGETGNYAFLDDGRLKLQIGAVSVVGTVVIEGKKMTVTIGDGQPAVFERVE